MAVITEKSKVKVHYTGKFVNGEVFDSSKPVKGTPLKGTEPLEVELGQGALIPGFEKALQGMSEGDTKTVTIPCEDAYGEPKDTHIQEVERQYVPETVSVGDALHTQTPQGPLAVVVKEVKEDVVVLDANHPLAGQDLVFELEVVSIS